MTTQTSPTTVSTEVDVDATAEHAFRVFTEGIGAWWDDDKHILRAPLAEMVFEPYVGGHIIDRGTDGSECAWATSCTVMVLHTTAAFARPACDAIVWEHGRRNMALADAGRSSCNE